tara:strand:- start:19 stop:816 length:798 start_codon:yes stop_codon:yes gene_type:complete
MISISFDELLVNFIRLNNIVIDNTLEYKIRKSAVEIQKVLLNHLDNSEEKNKLQNIYKNSLESINDDDGKNITISLGRANREKENILGKAMEHVLKGFNSSENISMEEFNEFIKVLDYYTGDISEKDLKERSKKIIIFTDKNCPECKSKEELIKSIEEQFNYKINCGLEIVVRDRYDNHVECEFYGITEYPSAVLTELVPKDEVYYNGVYADNLYLNDYEVINAVPRSVPFLIDDQAILYKEIPYDLSVYNLYNNFYNNGLFFYY